MDIREEYKIKTDKELFELEIINDANALNELGERFFENKEYEKGLEYLKKAMKYGNYMAINNIGVYHLVVKNDIEKAKEYFLRASNKEVNVAYNNLGYIYERENNSEKAEYYYKVAIKKGYYISYGNLGKIYEEKYKNYEKAEEMYKLMYEKSKNSEALVLTGILYYDKYKNKKKAINYLKKAINLGNVEAKHILEHFE